MYVLINETFKYHFLYFHNSRRVVRCERGSFSAVKYVRSSFLSFTTLGNYINKGENLYYENEQNMGQQRSPPVREGEQYDVQIESLGREGDGIAKVENFVVIVPNTKVGDNIKIRVTKVSRRVAFGEVIKGEAVETEEIEEMPIIDE